MTSPHPPVHRPLVNRILLAVDFGHGSRRAAACARIFARLFKAPLWIAHIVTPVVAPDAAFIHAQGALEYAEQHMRQFLDSEPWNDIPVRTVLRAGELWPTLSRVIGENGIDLIVTGTHHRNWLGRTVLGSAAELILRNAGCPVLCVSPRLTQPISDGLLRIVVPLDTQQNQHGAVSYIRELANDNNAQIVFLHVLHYRSMPLDYPDEEAVDDDRYSAAMQRFEQIIPAAETFRREPEIIIESGVPADVIVGLSSRIGADLIAMPVRRAAQAGTLPPWHTASRVLLHATCPVLTFAG